MASGFRGGRNRFLFGLLFGFFVRALILPPEFRLKEFPLVLVIEPGWSRRAGVNLAEGAVQLGARLPTGDHGRPVVLIGGDWKLKRVRITRCVEPQHVLRTVNEKNEYNELESFKRQSARADNSLTRHAKPVLC